MLYYYKDFKTLNKIVLGKLDNYFKSNKTKKLEIETFPNYAIILKIFFPDNIIINESTKQSGENIIEFLADYDSFSIIKINYINNKDKYKEKKIICIEEKDNDIDEIISDTFLSYDYIVHKFNEETVINKDLIETIEKLNSCDLFIPSKNSFIIEFAQNCQCKNILLFNKNDIKKVDYEKKETIFYKIDFEKSGSIEKFRMKFCYNNLMKKIPNLVSCVCPTYNRLQFMENLYNNLMKQTYKNKELIILDDSDDYIEIKKQELPNIIIRHIRLNKKTKLGKKRNLLNQLANGTYIVCFDDDDIYPSSRVSHAIHKITTQNVLLAGSSILHIYYSDINTIYEFGPYGKNHGTCGTFAYHIDYLKNNNFIDTSDKAEESYFTKKFTEKMIQLDPFKTILCIAHDNNTFDKKQILKNGKKTKYKKNKW